MNLRCPRGITLQTAAEKKTKLPTDFVWPAMVKSLQASGSLSAHDMAVVWNSEDVDKYAYPLYLQEYVNHDGTIFKVYVLGEDHFTVTRVSLPNFPATPYQAPVQFNSQDWKHELPPELTKEYTGKRVAPAHDVLSRASAAVSELLGLTLFGFDVIENVDTGRLAVIDVNYFPGTCISARHWSIYGHKRAQQVPPLPSSDAHHHSSAQLPSSLALAHLMQPSSLTTSLPTSAPHGALATDPLSSFAPSPADYRGVSDVFGKLLTHLLNMHARHHASSH